MIHSITPRPTTPDDGAFFNERESILQYNIDIDYSVKDTLKTFKEEVLDELYAQYSLHGNMPVMFSGGMDSTFIVRSLIELGIFVNAARGFAEVAESAMTNKHPASVMHQCQ